MRDRCTSIYRVLQEKDGRKVYYYFNRSFNICDPCNLPIALQNIIKVINPEIMEEWVNDFCDSILKTNYLGNIEWVEDLDYENYQNQDQAIINKEKERLCNEFNLYNTNIKAVYRCDNPEAINTIFDKAIREAFKNALIPHIRDLYRNSGTYLRERYGSYKNLENNITKAYIREQKLKKEIGDLETRYINGVRCVKKLENDYREIVSLRDKKKELEEKISELEEHLSERYMSYAFGDVESNDELIYE